MERPSSTGVNLAISVSLKDFTNLLLAGGPTDLQVPRDNVTDAMAWLDEDREHRAVQLALDEEGTLVYWHVSSGGRLLQHSTSQTCRSCKYEAGLRASLDRSTKGT